MRPPLARHARAAPLSLPVELAGVAPGQLSAIYEAHSAAPQFRVTVCACRWRDQGAGVVQELGFAVAEGIEMLARLTDAGMPAAEAAEYIEFTFAAGLSYFLEIAKLRAARILWARAVESFDPA